MIKPTMINYI